LLTNIQSLFTIIAVSLQSTNVEHYKVTIANVSVPVKLYRSRIASLMSTKHAVSFAQQNAAWNV